MCAAKTFKNNELICNYCTYSTVIVSNLHLQYCSISIMATLRNDELCVTIATIAIRHDGNLNSKGLWAVCNYSILPQKLYAMMATWTFKVYELNATILPQKLYAMMATWTFNVYELYATIVLEKHCSTTSISNKVNISFLLLCINILTKEKYGWSAPAQGAARSVHCRDSHPDCCRLCGLPLPQVLSQHCGAGHCAQRYSRDTRLNN